MKNSDEKAKVLEKLNGKISISSTEDGEDCIRYELIVPNKMTNDERLKNIREDILKLDNLYRSVGGSGLKVAEVTVDSENLSEDKDQN